MHHVADPTSRIPGPIRFGDARRLVEALSRPPAGHDDGGAGDLPRISDYLIDRRLGAGGGGAVYHAVLPGWNDEFAIKWMHRPVADPRTARRAWRELDLAEELDLEHTPRVFEYGVHEGRIYIVSEMIEGEPLDEYCTSRDLDRRARVELLIRVGDALHELHERGVIHRDIKPSNVLVRPDGQPVVIDLGIAAMLDGDPTRSLTLDGAALGTVAYMAPEQAIGATSIQTDIYSLGATACAILTGKTPHALEGRSVLEAIQHVAHVAPRRPAEIDPGLPRTLAAAVAKAVAPAPADRYRSAAEFADEMRCWLDGRPGHVEPRRWWRTLTCAVRRHPGRWTGAALVGIAVLGSAAAAGAVQLERLDERLVLLAELEARQAQIDDQWALVEKNIQVLVTRARNAEFRDAQRALGIVEGYARMGALDEGAEGRFELATSAFIAELLRGLYAGLPDPPSRSELALAAVRAVYQDEGRWDAARQDRIEQAIAELEW